MSIINTRSINRQDLATVPALSSMLFTSCFLALKARLSSVGLIPKIPVLDVSFIRQDVIVIVKQSDSIADVSIQRRSSPFDPSTSSSQSSRLSQMSCFKAEKVDRQTFVVDLSCIGRNQMCKETFRVCQPNVSHCCRGRLFSLTNIEPSTHVDDDRSSSQSMFNSIGQCVSFCHNVLRQTLRILVELQLKE